MTSAWEWDTTQVLFAQGWPQVSYAVTVTGEETHLKDVDRMKEKPKEAWTARCMTLWLINLKREDCHEDRVIILFDAIRVCGLREQH